MRCKNYDYYRYEIPRSSSKRHRGLSTYDSAIVRWAGKSIKALEDVMNDDKQILLTTQKDAANDDPGKEDVYQIGTIGTVLQLLKLPDGTVKVLVEGSFRAKISNFTDNEAFFEAYAEKIEETDGDQQEQTALGRAVVTQFEQYIKLNKKIPPEVLTS